MDGRQAWHQSAIARDIQGSAGKGEDSRATAWAGKAIAETLGLNVREPAVKKRILAMIKIWLDSGALKIVEAEDGNRPQREIMAEAMSAGIAEKTLRRAAKGTVGKRKGALGWYWWSLP